MAETATKSNIWLIGGIVTAVVAVIGGIYWYFKKPKTPVKTTTKTPTPTVASALTGLFGNLLGTQITTAPSASLASTTTKAAAIATPTDTGTDSAGKYNTTFSDGTFTRNGTYYDTGDNPIGSVDASGNITGDDGNSYGNVTNGSVEQMIGAGMGYSTVNG